jgi:hypothetical protein
MKAFEREYMSAPLELSPRERIARWMAADAEVQIEKFDQMVCTARGPRGWAWPANGRERQKIDDHAKQLRVELQMRAKSLFRISREELADARRWAVDHLKELFEEGLEWYLEDAERAVTQLREEEARPREETPPRRKRKIQFVHRDRTVETREVEMQRRGSSWHFPTILVTVEMTKDWLRKAWDEWEKGPSSEEQSYERKFWNLFQEQQYTGSFCQPAIRYYYVEGGYEGDPRQAVLGTKYSNRPPGGKWPMDGRVSKRWGKFEISGVLFRCGDLSKIQEILSQVIVVRADDCPWTDTIKYTAISDHFEELKEGEPIPDYLIETQAVRKGTRTELMVKAFRRQPGKSLL